VNEILNAMGQMGQMIDQLKEQTVNQQQQNEQLSQRIQGYEARQAEVDGKMELMLSILNKPAANQT